MSYFNNRQAFRPLSNEQLPPSIFATEASADRSDKYRFVPTIDVIDAFRSTIAPLASWSGCIATYPAIRIWATSIPAK